MVLDNEQSKEITKLRIWAIVVISWLVFLIFLSLAIVLWLFLGQNEREPDLLMIATCIAGGTLGSSIAALRSVLARFSHGWEFSDGKKYPVMLVNNEEVRKDKFSARMIPFFIARPFLGTAAGLIVYTGMLSGYLISVTNANQEDFSIQGLTFLSILGGMFAKTFFEKLNEIFKAIVGKT